MTNNRIEQARELTGEEKIVAVQMQLKRLQEESILASVNVSGLSLFNRATAWAELGITDADLRQKRFTPGVKHLINEKVYGKLRSCETRARENLKKYSHDLEGFRPFRLLPIDGYYRWKSRHESISREFEGWKQRVLDNLDQYRDAYTADMMEIAEKTWRQVTTLEFSGVKFGGIEYFDLDFFSDAVVQRALDVFPTREKIITEVQLTYEIGVIYSMADFEADRLEAAKLNRETSIEWARSRAEQDMQFLSLREAQERVDHDSRMRELEERQLQEAITTERAEREAKKQAILEAEREAINRTLDKVRAPIEAVMTETLETIAMTLTGILESINKNGHVKGKIAEQGAGLIELYEILSAGMADETIKEKLQALKDSIGPIGDRNFERSTENVLTALNDATQAVRTMSDELLADPNRAFFIRF